uniref:Putative LOC101238012 [Hydra vulgaris] n=1 Tax=Lepeophtheirus salmonis TaxID=72036 RepID=A0A0K2V0I3_LEPSM
MAQRLIVTKYEICNRYDIHTYHFGTGFGKPRFSIDIMQYTTPSDLVSFDSWFIFTLLGLETNSLRKKV